MIDRFLRNELSEEEIKLFRQKLLDDPDFKKEYLQKWAIQANYRKKELHKKLDLLQQVEENEFSSSSIQSMKSTNVHVLKRRRLLFITSAAAAVAILVLSFFSYWSAPSQMDNIFNAQFEAYPSSVIKRGSHSDLVKTKLQAYTLYEIGNYKEAAPLLELIAEQGDTKSYLYAGIANTGIKKFDKSNEYLVKYLDNSNEFVDVANLYLSINNMMLGQLDNAKQGFEQLSVKKGFVAKKSNDFLIKLKEIQK